MTYYKTLAARLAVAGGKSQTKATAEIFGRIISGTIIPQTPAETAEIQ